MADADQLNDLQYSAFRQFRASLLKLTQRDFLDGLMNVERSLPSNWHIRPAQATDRWSIRWLVLRAKLDPTQLRWQQFWLVEGDEQIIACGQLRTFSDCQELGSLVVRSAWRRQGIGTTLTKHLVHQATHPLYLECLGTELAAFYRRLGFVPITVEELPASLRQKFGISSAIARWLRLPLYQMHFSASDFDDENSAVQA